MDDYHKMKTALGIFAILIGIYSYIPYFRDIFTGRTKPHAFTWFVWFLLTAIAFFAQLAGNGGAGARGALKRQARKLLKPVAR